MEMAGGGSDSYSNAPGSAGADGRSSRRYGMPLSASNFIQTPISALLEYSGILRPRSSHPEHESLVDGEGVATGFRDHASSRGSEASVSAAAGGEVSIRIIGSGDQDSLRTGTGSSQQLATGPGREGIAGEAGVQAEHAPAACDRQDGDPGNEDGMAEGASSATSSPSISSVSSASTESESGNGLGGSNRDSPYQRYDIQQAARWIEQILPFSLLLLVVFIRQHLQGVYFSLGPLSSLGVCFHRYLRFMRRFRF
ncbi:hypothetical protein Taro_010816 [Colocasia esculenta]|uniref:Uncharacterized protein n=1 Tax=Colocasia esculenta TaxID=4460 RepID=A0A843TZY0_COLES|nr:hypothetical protein [Colocasia esculenta]